MKILVTGGAGFIGSHLCESLVKKGHDVVVIDNFDVMYSRAQKQRNLAWLLTQKNFTFIRGDVRKGPQILEIFRAHRFSHVFHLAGRGGIPQSVENPFMYLDEIMKGTMTLLESSAKTNVSMFVNASSSSLYGHTTRRRSTEKSTTDKPLSVYAALKKSSELLTYAYHVQYGLVVVNVRF